MSKVVEISREEVREFEKIGVWIPPGLCAPSRSPRKGSGKKKHWAIINGGGKKKPN